MKIKTKELLSILEMLRPGVDTKDVVESMTYFFFSGTDIITYNNKISIQHPFKTKFKLFIKAKDLYGLLQKTSMEEISLIQDGEKLKVSSKKFKANLATIFDEEVSERIKMITKSLKGVKWTELPENFSESISLCSFTTSNNESDGTLTCVHVDGTDCIASDNRRISNAVLSSDIDDMLIKASEIKNLVAIEPTEYSIADAWLHFKNKNGCIFSIRRISGEFPDYMQFFEFDGEKVDMPKDIIEGVDITSIFTDDETAAVKFVIKDNACILSVKSEKGTVKHRSKMKYSGKEVNFSINPTFIREMMTHSSSILVGKDKIKLQTENGFTLLTALFD